MSSAAASILRRLAALPIALLLCVATAQAEPLRVGYIPVLGVAQLFVLAGEGWAKEAGLDLVITRFDSGPAMIQALASGRLDVMYAGVSPVIVARASGIDVRVLAATATEEIVLVGRGAYADLVRGGLSAGPAVTRFAHDQGRTLKLATQPSGSVPDTVARYWLNEIAHVPAGDVEVLGIGIDKTQAALLAGAVDAAVVREPALTIIRDQDPNVQVLALGGEIFPGQPGSVLAVREAARARDPAAIDRLVKLHVRATELLRKDPKAALADVQGYIGAGLTEPAVLLRALSSPYSHFIADPGVIRESTDKMQRFQLSQGTLPKIAPLDELFDRGPYDRAVAN